MFFLEIGNTDFFALLPIGLNGTTNIFNGSLKSLTWFNDCVYLLFMIGEFKYEKNSGLKIILSFLLYIAIVMIFSICFYNLLNLIDYSISIDVHGQQ